MTTDDNFLSENLVEDLLKIAHTALKSKILSQHSDHFSKIAVDAVMRLGGSGKLDAIQIIKKLGGSMEDSVDPKFLSDTKQIFHIQYLDSGFLLEKKPGMYQPQTIRDAKILIANTPMDTDKVNLNKIVIKSIEIETISGKSVWNSYSSRFSSQSCWARRRWKGQNAREGILATQCIATNSLKV